jgi:hypothetical protein
MKNPYSSFVLDVHSCVFIDIKLRPDFKFKLLQHVRTLLVISNPAYSTCAIALIVLLVRLAAFMYSLSIGNLEAGVDCHTKYRRAHIVVARNPSFLQTMSRKVCSRRVYSIKSCV